MASTYEEIIAKSKELYAAGDIEGAKRLAKIAVARRDQSAPQASAPAISPEQRAANVAANADRQAGINQTAKDNMVLDSTGSALAGVTKFAQGLPFVGQYTDEFTGALGNAVGAMTGDKGLGDRAMTQQRAVQDAMDRKYPKTSTGLMLGGGIAGSAPLAAIAAPKILAQGATLLGKTILGALTGATAGGIEGAISGYGAGNEGDRTQSAMKGGAIGTAAGAGFGALTPIIGTGINAIAQRIKGMDVTAIAQAFGISKDAARALKPDLEALDFSSAQRNLATAGPDAMVADAGRSTRDALDAAVTGGGKASRIAVDAVSERAAQAGTRLGKVMDVVLGAPSGIKAQSKSIAQRTSAARGAAYKAAYAQPIDYAAPTGRAIEDVLQRVEPTVLQSAIKEANAAMREAGVTNKQIMATIGKDGNVSFKEMPNVEQLDFIKRGLDAVADAETDAVTGKITGAGIRASRLAKDLRGATVAANPTYGKAIKLGGDKIAEDRALETGRKIFGPGVSRETVRDQFDGASIEAIDAARKGIRGYIDDTLARVRRSFDDPEADTTETLKLLGTLSTRDAREKLEIVLGPQRASRLMSEIDAVGKQFGTRQAIATGSATGRREARSRALDDVLAPGVVGTAAKGNPFDTVGSAIRFLTRATPEADAARRQEVLAGVAKALTEMRGQKAQNVLRLVEKAISGQPLKSAEAAKIAQMVSTGGALTGYQTTQKYLSSPQRGQLSQQ